MNARTRNRFLAAVVAAMPLVVAGAPAQAQTRVNQNGGALDANTRVGSNGSNEGGAVNRRGQSFTGNQVVTGNVTGGRAFRGTVNYGDPLDFRGRIIRPSDRFIRDSARAPTRSQPNVNYGNESTAYYGDQRATPLPPGFRAEGYTGGFYNTGVAQTARQTSARNPVFQSTTRVFEAGSPLLRPGDVLFDGGLNGDNVQTLLSASPLYGVRPLNEGVPNGGLPGTETFARPNPADRFRVDPAQIEDMQRELDGGGDSGVGVGGEDGTGAEPADPNNLSIRQGAIGEPLGGADGGPLSGGALGGAGLTGSVRTGQSQQRRMAIPVEQQSKQYRALQERFQRQQRQSGRPLSDADANRQLGLLRQAQGAAGGAAGDDGSGEDRAGEGGRGEGDRGSAPDNRRPVLPGRTMPRRAPGDATRPQNVAPRIRPEIDQSAASQPATPADADAEAEPQSDDAAPQADEAEPQAADPAPQAADPESASAPAAPVQVKSLAEGVDAQGLRDLLSSAEDLMRAGKFSSAIEKYGTAQQVAPNNRLIQLGRAHAELGATRYGRAEQSLRQAVVADPALLMGQYDLASFMGRGRLSFLVKDLKQIATTEAGSPRPMLLLAYIAYNTPGSEAGAARYLDAAAERAGKPDAVIDLMREHWNPSGADQPAPVADEPEAEAPTSPATSPDSRTPEAGDADLNK